jgi:UDP-glucose 4-epimerase
MNKNVLVTGGSGFIGSNLVDRLVLFGYNVHVIDDLSTGLVCNQNTSASYSHLDLCDHIENMAEIQNILETKHIDIVYHLAASADIFLSVNNPETVYKINVLTSISLLQACIKANVKKFIFSSTSAVYGEPEYLPVDEKHITKPISPYGLTKLGFEQYINYCSEFCDIKFTVFRFPNIYGYRQRPDLEGGVIAIYKTLIDKKQDLKIFGDGHQTRDWVHVDDIIEACVKILDSNHKNELFLLGSDTKTSINQLIELFKEQVGCVGRLNYMSERNGDIRDMVMTYEKAYLMLQWSPKINLKDGVAALFETK